ncbi:MAG TPA: macro domain-containing protein [Thermomicrobiales bacterium]|nr:macro domain-containing protein [Thermomicrobiales bacterium]
MEVIEADIADVAAIGCEAYVNAANNELWMGAGVAGALKRAAGAEVEQEAVRQGPIAVGEAVITSAGKMPPPARAIIHAAAMGFTDRTQIYASTETVAAATRRALQLCDEQALDSVAFPALGTGVGGLDIDACAKAMVAAVREHLLAGSSLQRVVFVVRGSGATGLAPRAEVFRDEIRKQFSGDR